MVKDTSLEKKKTFYFNLKKKKKVYKFKVSKAV